MIQRVKLMTNIVTNAPVHPVVWIDSANRMHYYVAIDEFRIQLTDNLIYFGESWKRRKNRIDFIQTIFYLYLDK